MPTATCWSAILTTPLVSRPSGAQPLNNSTFGNRFLFTGREYVAEFGIYEYRNRAYHPGLGRFMSEDPKGFDAGDYNLFRYCSNDPLDRVDPMGLAEVSIDTLIKARSRAGLSTTQLESQRSAALGKFNFLIKTINNPKRSIADVKKAAMGAVGDFRKGSEYGAKDQIAFKKPEAGERGLVKVSDAHEKALVAAGVVSGHYTGGDEGGVGVTYNPAKSQWGLTHNYVLGHPTGAGANEVGLPKLAAGDDPLFGGKGHGHHDRRPISGTDRGFSHVTGSPNSININNRIWIYVPRMDAAPNFTGVAGETWGPY